MFPTLHYVPFFKTCISVVENVKKNLCCSVVGETQIVSWMGGALAVGLCWLNGHAFARASGDGEGQGSLAWEEGCWFRGCGGTLGPLMVILQAAWQGGTQDGSHGRWRYVAGIPWLFPFLPLNISKSRCVRFPGLSIPCSFLLCMWAVYSPLNCLRVDTGHHYTSIPHYVFFKNKGFLLHNCSTTVRIRKLTRI